MKKAILFFSVCVVLAILWAACAKDSPTIDTSKSAIGQQNETLDRSACTKTIIISGAQNFTLCGNQSGSSCTLPCLGGSYSAFTIDATPTTKTMINYSFGLTNNNATSKTITLTLSPANPISCTAGSSFGFTVAAGVTAEFQIVSSGGCCRIDQLFCD